jgi:ornithine cyclodeaminase
LGTGEQAETHIRAMALLRQWDEIRVWGRSAAKARLLAAAMHGVAHCDVRAVESVAAAVANAGVVCTLTASVTPIFTADMIEPGMHLNLVGSSVATAREVDSATVARASMFVDHAAMTRSAGGEFIAALQEGMIGADHIRGEIGEVLLGRVAGRRSGGEVTLFKSLGMPVEDLVAADFIYAAARRSGLGTLAPF